MRSKYGLAGSHQCMMVFDVCNSFRPACFVLLTSVWSRVKVPAGCYAEFPPVFTYKAEELRDSTSGEWVVAYTEFAVRTLAFLLFEARNNLRLWAVSHDTCRLARELELEPTLGSMGNVTELNRIIRVVEKTRFDMFSERFRYCGNYDAGIVCRVGPGADFLFYNIHTDRTIMEQEAYHMSHLVRDEISDGHPRCWDYTTIPDGWVGDENVWNTLADGTTSCWANHVPTDDEMMSPAGPSNANTNGITVTVYPV